MTGANYLFYVLRIRVLSTITLVRFFLFVLIGRELKEGKWRNGLAIVSYGFKDSGLTDTLFLVKIKRSLSV